MTQQYKPTGGIPNRQITELANKAKFQGIRYEIGDENKSITFEFEDEKFNFTHGSAALAFLNGWKSHKKASEKALEEMRIALEDNIKYFQQIEVHIRCTGAMWHAFEHSRFGSIARLIHHPKLPAFSLTSAIEAVTEVKGNEILLKIFPNT